LGRHVCLFRLKYSTILCDIQNITQLFIIFFVSLIIANNFLTNP